MTILSLQKAYHFSVVLENGEPVLRVTDDRDRPVRVSHAVYPAGPDEVASFSLFPVAANDTK